MILNILDENRELLEIINTFESCLWTKKYNDVGGCILVLAPTPKLVNLFKYEAKYISREDDSMICEIKQVYLSFDYTSNKYLLTITGLGVETLLSQRIVWEQTNFSGTAENFIRTLVNNNVINPTNRERIIDFIRLGEVKNFSETLTKQVTYDELLSTIVDICKTYDIGFRFVENEGYLYLDLYRGLDCSQDQDENEYVIFSKGFNNLHTFEWGLDKSNYKNVCVVGGEGEGTARKKAIVGTSTGINRYEMFVDAKSQSSESGAIGNYNDMLIENGNEELSLRGNTQSFSCKVDVEQYKYKEDYDLGYIVTVEADYGLTINAKIIEVVECEDANGYRITANVEI